VGRWQVPYDRLVGGVNSDPGKCVGKSNERGFPANFRFDVFFLAMNRSLKAGWLRAAGN